MVKTHEIKISEDFVEDILAKRKTFEVRENDRGYQAGDIVLMTSIPRNGGVFFKSGDSSVTIRAKISYVLSGWGIKEGFVVFGIQKPELAS